MKPYSPPGKSNSSPMKDISNRLRRNRLSLQLLFTLIAAASLDGISTFWLLMRSGAPRASFVRREQNAECRAARGKRAAAVSCSVRSVLAVAFGGIATRSPLRHQPSRISLLSGRIVGASAREWPGAHGRLALVLAQGNVVDSSDILLLQESQGEHDSAKWTRLVPLQNGWKDNLETLERTLVKRAIETAQGNKSRAAEILGIHRRLLYEKIRQYGLDQKQNTLAS